MDGVLVGAGHPMDGGLVGASSFVDCLNFKDFEAQFENRVPFPVHKYIHTPLPPKTRKLYKSK
jgi:hypothetical protein